MGAPGPYAQGEGKYGERLLELKYLQANAKPTQIEAAFAEAEAQVERCASDEALLPPAPPAPPTPPAPIAPIAPIAEPMESMKPDRLQAIRLRRATSDEMVALRGAITDLHALPR